MRFIVVMVAACPDGPCSWYVTVSVSCLTNSEGLRYFSPSPIVIRSSEVSGSLPWRSQQLWQSGQWHFHRTYFFSDARYGM